METYHGFEYTLDEFDRNAALEFILEHFVFMNTSDRPVSLQHEFISHADSVVKHMEASHNLRKAYYDMNSSINKITNGYKISTIFGIIAAMFLGFSMTIRGISYTPTLVLIILSILILVVLALPVPMMTRNWYADRKRAENLLSAIHKHEMDIASILSLVGIKNSVSMTAQRNNIHANRISPTRTIN